DCLVSLSDSESGVLSMARRMECQHDILLRNAGFHQLVRNAVFGPIVLDPELPTTEVDMDHAAMDPAPLLPAGVPQLVMATFIIEDGLCFHLSGRRVELGIIPNDSLDDLPILTHSIHWMISSAAAS